MSTAPLLCAPSQKRCVVDGLMTTSSKQMTTPRLLGPLPAPPRPSFLRAAVKCNPNRAIVRALAMNPGCGFDVASSAEMDQVLDCGVDPSRLIYANPCKDVAALDHALSGEHLRAGYMQR